MPKRLPRKPIHQGIVQYVRTTGGERLAFPSSSNIMLGVYTLPVIRTLASSLLSLLLLTVGASCAGGGSRPGLDASMGDGDSGTQGPTGGGGAQDNCTLYPDLPGCPGAVGGGEDPPSGGGGGGTSCPNQTALSAGAGNVVVTSAQPYVCVALVDSLGTTYENLGEGDVVECKGTGDTCSWTFRNISSGTDSFTFYALASGSTCGAASSRTPVCTKTLSVQ